ncbi:MAG: hypothetical protein ABSE84_00040 [Isosphaeraceae bacterium]|jgi:hypothetical protein
MGRSKVFWSRWRGLGMIPERAMTEFTLTLASPDASPPTSSSYWMVPELLLAGAYPGDPDPQEHCQKVQAIVGAGTRTFVNLMEEDETDRAGEPFVPYQDLARQFCAEVACVRYALLSHRSTTPAANRL